jgi:shikimate dehydrogenase
MNPHRPLLVASLPARTPEEARRQVALARDGGAEIAEIRLDRWSPEERHRTPELFPSALPLMATLRSTAEGGEGPTDPDERAREIRAAVSVGFEWIDLEADRDSMLGGELASRSRVRTVVSSHLPAGTPASEVARRLRSAPGDLSVRKVVLPASVAELLGSLIPALPPVGEGRRVLLTTGGSGALLRAWAGQLDFPLVYASLPERRDAGTDAPVEPSQIPVDRLRPFLDSPDRPPLFGVTGHPVAHSRSPRLHARWMRASGRVGLYVAFDAATEAEFVDALPVLAERGFRGLNVTHPWKEVALATASRVARGAEACGVANCLTFADGEVVAENTDLAAILRRLEEYRRHGLWSGEEVAVIGAGGAAAATLAAARELGARSYVLARAAERADPLIASLGATYLAPGEARPFSLVVHATPVGRRGAGPLEAPFDRLLGSGTRVLDWVYAPEEPVVREIAARGGAAYEDGWTLLVYQAAASFGVWWGAEPDPADVRSAIEEGPCTV